MGQCKSKETEPFPKQYPKFSLKGVHPDWEMHPSWIAGIEALNSYNFWVCEVMMPVAFQWIEEHHDEVYAGVAEEHKGDVGVVMAAAFQLVQELPSYKHWMDVYRNYEAAVTAGTWDPTEINPVWTKIVKQVRAGTEKAFASEEKVLKDTIR
jgi:hypothetical protein